jgi:16S rRNA (guanine(966)-N(2))-methyltransferase RsmD
MRIIAGRARGIHLVAPKGLEIRPTLDRVRESLFSILSPRLEGARFLDLFAGTGANGIEALSRGASAATFVDEDRRALDVVRDNLTRTRLESKAQVLKARLPQDLRLVDGLYDIIFADPPYAFADYAALIEGIAGRQLLTHDGLFILEHDRRCPVPETDAPWTRVREARYGDTVLSFYA